MMPTDQHGTEITAGDTIRVFVGKGRLNYLLLQVRRHHGELQVYDGTGSASLATVLNSFPVEVVRPA